MSAQLARWAPILAYDSAERWFATSVQSWRAGPAGTGPQSRAPGDEVVYGHAARGSDGRLWLAYWCFYLRNDPRLLGPWLAVGAHEGDWEMIQLRLDAQDEAPDLVLFAQHAHVAARAWTELEHVDEHPVLHVARGSHAAYDRPGWHWIGVWFERADGRGRRVCAELVEILDEGAESDWARWPGRWGATEPRTGWVRRLGLVAASPRGPGHQRQWRDPAVLMNEIAPRRRAGPGRSVRG